MGLTIGLSSIRFALDSKWEHAVCCTLVAAIFDGIDGRIARLFNATSNFGAELDSLCDFANFGICPAIIIYLWSFQQYELKLISWAVILLFVVCMAIRLARFNTSIFYEQEINNINSKYFSIGVPAPPGAILSLMPVMLDFEITNFLSFNIRPHTLMINIYVALIAILLPSRLPTFLFKNVKIKSRYILPFFIISAIIIINTLVYPWVTLPILGLLYMLSIPCCILIDKRIKLK
ncbi:MAG: phosphatidylcholine/phosphatidylserine synthase [Rickettsiaceae bacterium]|nr:MAG: phosphatidylcholine/phosphatidylserine synthase [Rickettsiaceae bacterium]